MRSVNRNNQTKLESELQLMKFVGAYLSFMVNYIKALEFRELCRTESRTLEQNIAMSFSLLSDVHTVSRSSHTSSNYYSNMAIYDIQQQIYEQLSTIQELLQNNFHDVKCLDVCIDALIHLQQCYPRLYKAKCSNRPWVASKKGVFSMYELSN